MQVLNAEIIEQEILHLYHLMKHFYYLDTITLFLSAYAQEQLLNVKKNILPATSISFSSGKPKNSCNEGGQISSAKRCPEDLPVT